MNDKYETLGITPDATAREIKIAYAKLALVNHPDKGGDAEKMKLLNEAYQTLSDPERRRDFDSVWKTYREADVSRQPDVAFEGYLQVGKSVSYSHKFRSQHKSLVAQYEKTPLTKKEGSFNASAKIPDHFSSDRSVKTMTNTMIPSGNLMRKRVNGDGNCLFYSIIEGLNAINHNGNNFDAKTLREFVAEKIRVTATNLNLCGGQTLIGDDITDALRELRIKKENRHAANEALLPGMANNSFTNKNDYVNYIKINFAWASMIEINIIAHYLNIRIIVNDLTGEQLSEICPVETVPEATIFILFSGDHYDALITPSDETTAEAQNPMRANTPSFESGIYSLEEQGIADSKCHDIFEFIRLETKLNIGKTVTTPTNSITPVNAIKLFMDFLSGSYYGEAYELNLLTSSSEFRSGVLYLKNIGNEGVQYTVKRNDQTHNITGTINAEELAKLNISVPLPKNGLIKTLKPKIIDILNITTQRGHSNNSNLIMVKRYLASEIKNLRLRNLQAPELLLYEGIFEVILMTEKMPSERNGLIFSIKKITDFAKLTSDLLLKSMLPLFYSKFFRNLQAYALHLYWNSSEDLFDAKTLVKFNGYQEAKELLDVLKERLSSGNQNEHLSKLIQAIKLVFNFEKDKHESGIKLQSAADYRESAFHFLDWLSVFLEQGQRQTIVNICLQIGIKFQQASRLETTPAIKMADEKLAFKMYLTAAGIGFNTTPDVEIYANTQALKYISAFQFQDAMLNEVVPDFKRRTLFVMDVFPFFESHQSNVAFFKQGNQTIRLMRHMLNALNVTYEYNKTNVGSLPMAHAATTILYQAYEACLKNWYQEEYDPATEQKFRLDLMEELLFENSWTFLDVEQNIDSPWIMVGRDEQGWMTPTRSLPFTDDVANVNYSAINGAEVNRKTGDINFFMTSWTQDRPIYEQVFTLFDVQEMLEKNISGAYFSLDPIDPDKPHHPFNIMHFAPSQLCESELLNTMLLTDYVLKFLTTNQEVQGHYPFEQRPVDRMIEHLPAFLRQIIYDFHSKEHSGEMHRFWIEAEEVDLLVSNNVPETDDVTRIGLSTIKMVVKKHRMERDIHGELKDVGNEVEGWPIYVLTTEEMQELERGNRIIDGHAMIFIYAEHKVFFWENNEIIKSHVPEDYRETLIRIFKQPKDQDGKVAQNTKNMPLMYRATKEMARQSGLPHRYSPEFIFSHEFTTQYDIFAQYLPEFGRLKELSKLSTLIRYLNGMRTANKESIQALDYLLDTTSQPPVPDTDSYRNYNQHYQKSCQNIMTNFHNWRNDCSYSVFERKRRDQLNGIKDQIGTLSQLSSDERSNYKQQLIKIFSTQLSSVYAYGGLIDSFLDGNIKPLADELVNYDKRKAQQEIEKIYPHGSTKNIALALDDLGGLAATRVAIEESRRLLREQKESNNNLEAGFANINLGKDEEPVDLEGKCFWVPASVRHEVRKDDTTGLTRYSFFVYGGVNIQPRINVVAGGNRPLGGKSVGNPAARSLDNRATREWYHKQLEKIPALINNKLPLRERALQAVKLRNDIKMQARELMADQKLAGTLKPPVSLKKLTKNSYDANKIGDQHWNAVLGSSQRTNQTVDSALGTQNLYNKDRSKI